MIKVTYESVNEQIASLEIKGHALSAEHGQDLICSAVSAVTFGGLNALHSQQSFAIAISEGYVAVAAKGEISSEDEIVLKTILTQLETIARENPKNVKIIRKEKKNNDL